MNLGSRLKCIADQIEKGGKVADIGTDHAYIPVYIVQAGISDFVIASDVNVGPLEKAKKHIVGSGLEKNISARLGGGLSPIAMSEVDQVIIAGMGGVLISSIIEADFEKAKRARRLILQPMQAQYELRKYLYERNFTIQGECLAKEDDKIYEIIVASYSNEESKYEKEPNDISFETGQKLLETEEKGIVIEFLDKKIIKYEDIISSIKGNKTIKATERLEFCIERIKKLREIREDVAKRAD